MVTMLRLILLLLSNLSWEFTTLSSRRKRSTFIFNDEGKEVFYFFHYLLLNEPFLQSDDGIYKGNLYVRENGRWSYKDDLYISVEDFQKKFDMSLVEVLQNESYKSISNLIAMETTASWKKGGLNRRRGLEKRSEFSDSDLESSLPFFEVCDKLENETTFIKLNKSPKSGVLNSLKRWACIGSIFPLYVLSLPFMYIIRDFKNGTLFLMFCATTYFQVPTFFYFKIFIAFIFLSVCVCSLYMDLKGEKIILSLFEKTNLIFFIEKLRSNGYGRCNPFTNLLSLSKTCIVFDDEIIDERLKIKESCFIPLNSDTVIRDIKGDTFSVEFKQVFTSEYKLSVKNNLGKVIHSPVVSARSAKIITNFFDYFYLNENNLVCDGSISFDAMGSIFIHALSIDFIDKLISGRVLKQCFLENEIEIRGETLSIPFLF